MARVKHLGGNPPENNSSAQFDNAGGLPIGNNSRRQSLPKEEPLRKKTPQPKESEEDQSKQAFLFLICAGFALLVFAAFNFMFLHSPMVGWLGFVLAILGFILSCVSWYRYRGKLLIIASVVLLLAVPAGWMSKTAAVNYQARLAQVERREAKKQAKQNKGRLKSSGASLSRPKYAGLGKKGKVKHAGGVTIVKKN